MTELSFFLVSGDVEKLDYDIGTFAQISRVFSDILGYSSII